MTRIRYKSFLPVLIFFIALNGLFISGKSLLEQWGADQQVLIIGNLILFMITFVSFVLAVRGLKNPNPHVFMRSVFSSIIIKLFLCIIVVFAYIASFQKQLNKPALFTCMGLYLVYTFLEVSALTRLLKQNTNG
ncbi:MAG TPA: hypothetical protein VFR58_14675 [Flavisolibacter sp.]|nr:hypothetical protein [Flavisolibacter sp.]